MIMNGGYLDITDDDYVDNRKSITVNSAGFYKLIQQEEFNTCRPMGRRDFQILYVASGKGKFFVNGKAQWVNEGHTILYLPGDHQEYYYRLCDNPEIYWVHFSGYDIPRLLEEYQFLPNKICWVGFHSEYNQLFDKLIQEFQLRRKFFPEQADHYFASLFTLLGRNIVSAVSPVNETVETAVQFFHQHFPENISIQNYAAKAGMSACWFTRCFREATGKSPQQYITNLRISKAKEMLSTSSLNVSEIADLIGYQNSLYFSRIFHKNTGMSPLHYRNLIKQGTTESE